MLPGFEPGFDVPGFVDPPFGVVPGLEGDDGMVPPFGLSLGIVPVLGLLGLVVDGCEELPFGLVGFDPGSVEGFADPVGGAGVLPVGGCAVPVGGVPVFPVGGVEGDVGAAVPAPPGAEPPAGAV